MAPIAILASRFVFTHGHGEWGCRRSYESWAMHDSSDRTLTRSAPTPFTMKPYGFACSLRLSTLSYSNSDSGEMWRLHFPGSSLRHSIGGAVYSSSSSMMHSYVPAGVLDLSCCRVKGFRTQGKGLVGLYHSY